MQRSHANMQENAIMYNRTPTTAGVFKSQVEFWYIWLLGHSIPTAQFDCTPDDYGPNKNCTQVQKYDLLSLILQCRN